MMERTMNPKSIQNLGEFLIPSQITKRIRMGMNEYPELKSGKIRSPTRFARVALMNRKIDSSSLNKKSGMQIYH
jgi:hypothetical protein